MVGSKVIFFGFLFSCVLFELLEMSTNHREQMKKKAKRELEISQHRDIKIFVLIYMLYIRNKNFVFYASTCFYMRSEWVLECLYSFFIRSNIKMNDCLCLLCESSCQPSIIRRSLNFFFFFFFLTRT